MVIFLVNGSHLLKVVVARTYNIILSLDSQYYLSLLFDDNREQKSYNDNVVMVNELPPKHML